MTIQTDAQFIARLKSLAQIAAGVVTLVGGVVLVGWVFDVASLKSLVPGLATMKANTALSFVIAGTALWLLTGKPALARRRLSVICAVSVGVLACLILSQDLGGWNLGIDQLLFRDSGGTATPGRMSPATAFTFILVSSALLLLDVERWWGWLVAQFLALAAGAVALLALVGYTYNVQSLYRLGPFSSMALHTAMTFFILTVAILAARPERGLMAPLTPQTAGGSMIRRLLPAAIVAPFLSGWLSLLGQQAGLYNVEVGMALFALTLVFVFAGLIWWDARLLHRTDAARKRAEDRFRLVVEAAPNAVILVSQAGIISLVNTRTEALFGYTREALLGQPIEMLVPSQFSAHHNQHREAFFAEPMARPMGMGRDLFGLRKDGSQVPVEIGLNPITTSEGSFVLASVIDITERKQAEQELKQTTAELLFLNDLVTQTTQPMSVADLQGQFVRFNRAFEQLTGYSAAELYHLTYQQLTPTRWHDMEVELIAQLMATGQAVRFEKEYRRKDGVLIPVELVVELYRDAGGHPQYLYGFVTDITERKRAENELRQTATELARSNAELEQFAYIASHDLQEPLRAVAGTVQLLQQRYAGQLDSRADEFIEHAVDGASRMQTLINDLLNFSRVGTRSRSFQPTNCDTILKQVLANLAVAIAESGAVVTADTLPTVMADATQLSQLLQNLISNAIKFRRNGCAPAIHIGVVQQVEAYLFSLSDNGIGMESQYFERIFGVFQRLHTRRDYPGTGIGLAICKKIVERHGGSIWVESEPGQGSTFYFTLPCSRHEAVAQLLE